METKRSTLKSIAFQQSYSSLLGIQYGLHTVANEAYAAELITEELRKKCIDKGSRTEAEDLLDAVHRRLVSKPETFDKFTKILEDTTGLHYLAEDLRTSLNKAKKEAENEGEKQTHASLDEVKKSHDKQQGFTTPIHGSQGLNSSPSRSLRRRSKDTTFSSSLFGAMMNAQDPLGAIGTKERKFSAPSVKDTPSPTPKQPRVREDGVLRQRDVNVPLAAMKSKNQDSDLLEKMQNMTTTDKENWGQQRSREGSTSSNKSSSHIGSHALSSDTRGSKDSDKRRDFCQYCAQAATKYRMLQKKFRKHRLETNMQLRIKDSKIARIKRREKRTREGALQIVTLVVKMAQNYYPGTDSSDSPAAHSDSIEDEDSNSSVTPPPPIETENLDNNSE